MPDPVLFEREDCVAVITLNSPAKRNALDLALVTALEGTLARLQDDASIRSVVLHGGRHFCAGGDLGSLGTSPLTMRTSMHLSGRMIRVLTAGRLPVVAAVEGNAYGAGFSLALAGDFIVGDETTTFCAAFARLGLVPDYGLPWTLPQRIGIGKARELMMFAEPVRGAAAQAIGLIDRLVPAGKVLETALDMASRLAAAPPATISATKALLSRAPQTLDAVLGWEADTQSMLCLTEDFKEGVAAFTEKRSARFKGQ